MKKNFIILAFAAIFAVLLGACSNREQEDASVNLSKSEEILKKYASSHNSGLDFVKTNLLKGEGRITQKSLMSALEKYVTSTYNNDDANVIIQEITPFEEEFFNGNIPTLTAQEKTRKSAVERKSLTRTVINECMNKISIRLKDFNDDEIFDNKQLLNELHGIIIKMYNKSLEECSSKDEEQELSQAIGVLYGSIEYWMVSRNMKSWGDIHIEEVECKGSQPAKTKRNDKGGDNKGNDKGDNKGNDKGDKKEHNKEDDKKLSTAEFITTLAAADALGAYLGGGIASGPAAVAASAAAGIYFDTKK